MENTPPQNQNLVDPMDQFDPVSFAPQQPAVTPTPPVPPETSATSTTSAPRGKSKLPMILGIAFGALLLLTLATGTVFGLIAYKKINIKNPALQKKILMVVQGIPGLPKTPEYVMYKSLKEDDKIKTAYLDAYIQIQGSSIKDIIQGGSLNLRLFGPIDATDPEKTGFDLIFQLGEMLDMNFVDVRDDMYFKINKLSGLENYLALIGISGYKTSNVTGEWVHLNANELTQKYSGLLEEDSTSDPDEFMKKFEELGDKVIEQEILPKAQLTTEKLNGAQTYKISADLKGKDMERISKMIEDVFGVNEKVLGATTLDYNQNKLDELKVTFTIWIDKSTYFSKRFVKVIESTDGSNDRFELSVDFRDQNKPVEIKTPTTFVEFDDYLARIVPPIGMAASLSQEKQQEVLDTIGKVIDNINTGVQNTYSNYGVYPSDLDAIFDKERIQGLEQMYVFYGGKSQKMVVLTTWPNMSFSDTPYLAVVGTNGVSEKKMLSKPQVTQLANDLDMRVKFFEEDMQDMAKDAIKNELDEPGNSPFGDLLK